MESGGEGTLSGFAKLADDDKTALLEYFEEFSLFEEAQAGGREYVLCHNMPLNFEDGKEIDDYSAEDVLDGEVDYERDYFPGKTLVTAHKTTIEIDRASKGKIYKNASNVAIDCGALYGGYLAAFCLDNGEEFYV
jgi:serine/threonine protein phosphatase 1